jgi:hypothetical protein
MLAIVICGGVIAGRRFREPLILASLAAMIANFYVSASWWSWEVAGRATFENLPIVAIAIAQITEMVPGLWLRIAFIGMITLWSAPIVFGGYQASEHLVAAWLRGLRLLV